MYQIIHIHQIKNLYTKLFENTPNLLYILYIYTCYIYYIILLYILYIYQLATLVPTNTDHIQTYIAYSFYHSLWYHHQDCYASCRLIFLPCVCFASIYASTAVKSYILSYMWTAENFIIKGRRLCTVVLNILGEHGHLAPLATSMQHGYHINDTARRCVCGWVVL